MASRLIIIIPPGGMDQILGTLEDFMAEWMEDSVERDGKDDASDKSYDEYRSGLGLG
jgi:hypothetical protein